MSARWMAVQYVGDTLRLPVVNEGDIDKPFGSSVLERDIKRIVVNPFSDSPQTFVPELENAKLRELVEDMLDCIDIQIAFERVPARWMQDEFAGRARKLGIEVDA